MTGPNTSAQASTVPASSVKRVVRFDHWIAPAFPERLSREDDIKLDVIALHGDETAAWQALAQAHIYHISAAVNELPATYRADARLLARCPQLLCVSSGGAGHDTVDVEACSASGVLVVNQIGGNAASVAEMAIGLMLAVSRRIVESDRKLRSERGFSREAVMGHDLEGRTLGIVGIGHAGKRTAQLAQAFGMKVLASDPLLSAETIRARGGEPVTLDDLVCQADIISLHCPFDDSTRNLFDEQRFKAMKPGAIFVSTARGGIHDEDALAAALQSGHLAGAGLDVWANEPPPLNHPLLAMDKVVATFHTAGVSHEGRGRVAAMGAEQIVSLLRGQSSDRIVNPQVWETFLTRLGKAFPGR